MVGVEQSVQTDGREVVWAQSDTFGRLLECSEFGSLFTVSPTIAAEGCKREEEKGHVYVWPVNRQILPAELYSNNMLTVPSYNCRDHKLKVMGQMQRLTLIQ